LKIGIIVEDSGECSYKCGFAITDGETNDVLRCVLGLGIYSVPTKDCRGNGLYEITLEKIK
jgi:hypothetical protein